MMRVYSSLWKDRGLWFCQFEESQDKIFEELKTGFNSEFWRIEAEIIKNTRQSEDCISVHENSIYM